MSDPQQKPRRANVSSRKGRWAGWELKFLDELYGTRDDAVLARRLVRPVKSVRERAEELFHSKPNRCGQAWTTEEDERLKLCVGVSQLKRIATILRRSEDEIRQRLDWFGGRLQSRKLHQDELKRFKSIYGSREDEHLAIVFGCPIEDIQNTAKEMQLAKDKSSIRKWRVRSAPAQRNGEAGAGAPGIDTSAYVAMKMPRWTPAEIQQLRALYPSALNVHIARAIGRSVKSIMSKANDLKLGKSKEFLAEMGKSNVSVRYNNGQADLKTNNQPQHQKDSQESSNGEAEADG
ncbi:MAG: hypothetical protein ACKVS6_16095 [Planctomycetota bacterium]